jgi:AraC family transcriptional regulator of adaptative response/methylated-DNA-[protein]-cysteine methyltransferase
MTLRFHSDSRDAIQAAPVAAHDIDAAVTRAIRHLAEHWQDPPSLEDLSQNVAGMSPGHFQRRFKALAGISPKRFAQQLTLTHAKHLLSRRTSLLEASLSLGLSGPSRLHDLFVSAEAMTPGEYKACGKDLVIRWGVHATPIGPAVLGMTGRGLCFLGFGDERSGLAGLERDWSAATLVHDPRATTPAARAIFERREGEWPDAPLPVLLRGTNFQLQVWRALLRIPHGSIATYGDVARAIDERGEGKSVRAVGMACGANRIAYVIPCHRVIQSTGALCGYAGGLDRKRALLALEAPAAIE